jgi:hypothetical protein
MTVAIKEKMNVLGLPERIEGMGAFEAEFARALNLVVSDPEVAAKANLMATGNPVNVLAVPTVDKWTDKMLKNAQAAAGDWVENASAAVDAMKANALVSGGRYATGVQAAITEKRYDKGVQSIDTNEVRTTIANVGASGYSNGITARAGKIRAAIANLQPKVAALKQTIANMPQDTDAQRESRLLAARKGMIAIGKT